MIFNHEDENWKNSEVARTMLEILAAQQAAIAETTPAPQVAAEAPDDSHLFAEAREELDAFHRTGASHIIINELNKIAESVGDNARASLEIELAIEDIKELLK